MGGMGGPGGPGGGGPPQPPPPKPFPGGVKKARTMCKELRGALKSTTAKAAIKAAMGSDSDPPEQRMQTLGPVIEGLTAGVCKKYEFAGGFQEAMQSIAAIGGKEQDSKIRDMMDELGEIITGQKSPTKLKAENDELRKKLAECEAKL